MIEVRDIVSIIVPVYNVEKYIEQCLQSIFNQSYKNIEVIIVNDGSTDNSKSIIKKFCNKYKNIIYIEQKNQGLSMARNRGLKEAKGNYIAFVDSDDYIDRNYIQDMYNEAIEKDSDIVICGYSKVCDNGTVIENDLCGGKKQGLYSGKDVAEAMLDIEIKGYAWNKLYKNNYNFRESMKFEKDKKIEDYYPVFRTIVSSQKVSIIKKSLYNYRQRETSIVNNSNNQLVNDFFYACSKIIDLAEKLNLKKEKIEFFKGNCYKLTMLNYMDLNSDKGFKLYFDFKRLGYDIYEPSYYGLLKSSVFTSKDKLLILMYKMKILRKVIKFRRNK